MKKWWHDNWLEVALFGLKTLGTVGMIFGAYAGARKGVETAFDLSKAHITITSNGETLEDVLGNDDDVVEVGKF